MGRNDTGIVVPVSSRTDRSRRGRRGAGIAGLTAAALLDQQGRRVVVVEAVRVASGATGYTTAKLSALHGLIYDELARAYGDGTTLLYADANLAGIAKVAELVDRYDIACDLETRPAFTYTSGRVPSASTTTTVGAGAAAAMMLVDRIIGNDNPRAGVFDSSRFNVRQSASDVVKEHADVVSASSATG